MTERKRWDYDPNRGNRRVPISTVSAADLLGLNDDEPTPGWPGAIERVRALADQWDTDEDARYSSARIAN